MSVDREYATHISKTVAHPGATESTPEFTKEDSSAEGKIVPDERLPRPDLNALLEQLNNVLQPIVGILQTGFTEKAPTPASLDEMNQRQILGDAANYTPPSDDARREEFPPQNGDGHFQSVESSPKDSETPSEFTRNFTTGNDMGVELINQARLIHSTFQSHSPGISQQDAAELFTILRQLGEAFSQQGRTGVTRQELKRELAALRQLMESKK